MGLNSRYLVHLYSHGANYSSMFTAKKIRNIHLTTNADYPQIRKILQRIFNATEMPKYAKKISDMRTLLKYAKMQQSAKYAAIAYSRFYDMPKQCISPVNIVLL